MSRNPATASEAEEDGEVMASIDTGESAPRLVIADITADDSWLSIAATAAAPLSDWR